MSKKALNLNIDELLFDKLTQYRKLKGVTATSVIEELIDNLHLNVDKNVDTSLAHADNVDKNVDRIYMTEERFDYRVEPFAERLKALEEAIDYYDKALTSLIEEPTLLNLFKDEQTQEQLILFIERLKDTNASKTISITPEALGSRS